MSLGLVAMKPNIVKAEWCMGSTVSARATRCETTGIGLPEYDVVCLLRCSPHYCDQSLQSIGPRHNLDFASCACKIFFVIFTVTSSFSTFLTSFGLVCRIAVYYTQSEVSARRAACNPIFRSKHFSHTRKEGNQYNLTNLTHN
jgi:hypothetical protein